MVRSNVTMSQACLTAFLVLLGCGSDPETMEDSVSPRADVWEGDPSGLDEEASDLGATATPGPRALGDDDVDDIDLDLVLADEEDDAKLSSPLSHGPPPTCGAILTRSVTLRDDIGPCPGDGLVIGKDDVTLDCDGHTLRGSLTGTGVFVKGRASVRIRNCRVVDFGVSLLLEDTRGTIVERNRLADLVQVQESRGDTIARNRLGLSMYVVDAYALTVAENRRVPAYGNLAIEVHAAPGLRVRDNRLAGGVDFQGTHAARLDGNDMEEGFVYGTSSRSLRLEDNRLYDTFLGFTLYNAQYTRLEDNVVEDREPAPTGAAFDIGGATTRSLLVENEVYDTPEVGFALRASSSSSALIENRACGNEPYDAVWEIGSANNRLLYNDFCTRSGY
jgi:hypothetical protein